MLSDILLNSWHVIFKNNDVMKVQKGLRNCSRLKETGETRQLGPVHGPGLNPFVIDWQNLKRVCGL